MTIPWDIRFIIILWIIDMHSNSRGKNVGDFMTNYVYWIGMVMICIWLKYRPFQWCHSSVNNNMHTYIYTHLYNYKNKFFSNITRFYIDMLAIQIYFQWVFFKLLSKIWHLLKCTTHMWQNNNNFTKPY